MSQTESHRRKGRCEGANETEKNKHPFSACESMGWDFVRDLRRGVHTCTIMHSPGLAPSFYVRYRYYLPFSFPLIRPRLRYIRERELLEFITTLWRLAKNTS